MIARAAQGDGGVATPTRPESIADLVSSQAAARADSVAVASTSRVLRYGELDARADALAARLRSLGVTTDVVVGLCIPRSPAMVVAALGVLKAGGAYLPLDPTYPSARLSFMLADAGVPVLIAAHCAKNQAPAGDHRTITIDDAGRIIESPSTLPAVEVEVDFSPENLAYVIYTSGSTGQPKGVEVTHEGLLNLVHWHQRAFRVTSADRASQVAKVGFDAAVWEIWPYLTAGASLYVADEKTVSDPDSLRDWLVAQGITISFVPTPMAERLLTLSWPAGTALRTMLTGADTLHYYPPAGLPFELINNYGPTECTVVTTSGLVSPNGAGDGVPSIGRPIDRMGVYILDESGRPVPTGTQGELYIGGVGLARGYRNQPEMTAKRFVPSPLNGDTGKRLFRTGDRAKFLPDGEIAFLGRMDDQVKVRGHRVEPDEVTAALNRHPHVRQSIVVAREPAPGDVRLAGYFVAAPDANPSARDLRDFLGATLPDYMIPVAFVKLEELPLTANGKIDRAALPAPDDSNTLRDSASTAPRTDMEKAVASILGPLLGLENVDVEENFFALGGHSLLGAQLMARVRDTFGVEVPLRTLFEAPTIAELSAEIERRLVAKLEAMSDSEVQRLLDSSPRPDGGTRSP
ncbi:MAG TPA: amino acid adenylation domain-containing protein [Verrucomicrobiae bacterium]|nr:amino acid adenylation domain-containing protein [Verrucomicrobiae bacterium]